MSSRGKEETADIKKRLLDRIERFIGRIKDVGPDGMNLYDASSNPIYLDKLNTNVVAKRNIDPRDIERIKMQNELALLLDLLQNKYTNALNASVPSPFTLDQFTNILSYYEGINTVFKDINRKYKNIRESLSGIPESFEIRLKKMEDAVTEINDLKSKANVKAIYADNKTIIKDMMYPKRETTNKLLQDIIVDYSENAKDKLEELAVGINDDLIYSNRGKKYLDDDENKKKIYVGVNRININEIGKPRYEIYVALDVVEGEYNDKNINKLKCTYLSLYLGDNTENMFSSRSARDIQNDRMYISFDDIKKNNEYMLLSKANNPPPPPTDEGAAAMQPPQPPQPPVRSDAEKKESNKQKPEPKSKGGRNRRYKTRKSKYFYKNRKTRKNHSK
jgi:hypothetical protein